MTALDWLAAEVRALTYIDHIEFCEQTGADKDKLLRWARTRL